MKTIHLWEPYPYYPYYPCGDCLRRSGPNAGRCRVVLANSSRIVFERSRIFCTGPIGETHSLSGMILPAGNIVPVLLKKDTFVLPSGGGRDVIITFLQPIEDFFGGVVTGLSAFRVKVGQYLLQTNNTDLCFIRKPQHAPTNCRRFGIASRYSSYHFKG